MAHSLDLHSMRLYIWPITIQLRLHIVTHTQKMSYKFFSIGKIFIQYHTWAKYHTFNYGQSINIRGFAFLCLDLTDLADMTDMHFTHFTQVTKRVYSSKNINLTHVTIGKCYFLIRVKWHLSNLSDLSWRKAKPLLYTKECCNLTILCKISGPGD